MFGVFVTMNPNYQDRVELPDNLKSLLRPISMVSPDLDIIADIIFKSLGFLTA
jgi:dynein heavy chain